MRDIALTVFIFGMLPSCLFFPPVGLLMWSWVGYMSPHRLTWGFAYNFRFVYILALATLAGIFISKARLWKNIPITRTTKLLLFFVVWTNVTTFFALNPWEVGIEWERFMKIQFMVVATFMVIQERVWIHRLAWVITVSIGFYGLKGGIFTLLHGGSHRVLGPPGSFFFDNNAMALALITTIPLMRYLQLQSKNFFVRFGLLIMMVTSFAAVIGTYSRGGLVGVAVLSVAFWMKTAKRWLSGLLMILIIPALLNYMPDKWQHRMETILVIAEDTASLEEDRSAQGRVNAWHFAVNLAMDRPLVGGGFRVFAPHLFPMYAPDPLDYHDAHSIYFEVLGEQGFVGLLLFVALFISGFRDGTWIIRRCRYDPQLFWARDLAVMMQVGLVGYAASGSFLGLAYFDLPYHFLAMLVLTRVAVAGEIAKNPDLRTEKIKPRTEVLYEGRSIFDR